MKNHVEKIVHTTFDGENLIELYGEKIKKAVAVTTG